MSSRIHPAGYGTVYRTWSQTGAGPDAYAEYSRNVFGGPVTVYSILIKNSGGQKAYVKLYDSMVEFDDGGSTLSDPLMIFPVNTNDEYTLTIPGGYAFTTALTIRATLTGGTAGAGDPGTVTLAVVGR